jgi:hypothetical protein
MEIKVDERFKLRTDRTGWEVVQYREAAKGPKAGTRGWFSDGHYDTLPWALRGLYRSMLHEGRGEATLLQLAERIEQAEIRIIQALNRLKTPPKAPQAMRDLEAVWGDE